MKNRIKDHPIRRDRHLELTPISFRIVSHTWIEVLEMMKTGEVEPDILKKALSEGHGIEFDPSDNPTLFFVLDSEMRQKLHDANYRDPSPYHLIATSRCVALSEQDARDKWAMMLENNN